MYKPKTQFAVQIAVHLLLHLVLHPLRLPLPEALALSTAFCGLVHTARRRR